MLLIYGSGNGSADGRRHLGQVRLDYLHNKQVICLNIPDEYEFMDPTLVKLLKSRVSRFLPSK